MKKIAKRIFAGVLAAVMMLALTAGCDRETDSDESTYELPEFIYVPEYTMLPEDIGDVGSLVFSDNKIILATYAYEHDEETYSYTSGSVLWSMDLDGTNLTKLTGYKPPIDAPVGANGGATINKVAVDGDGNLWVQENYDFSIYNLPDNFDSENDMPWNYYEQLASGSALRKLDSTGAEISSVNLDGIAAGQEYFYVQSFNTDSEGNIYLLSSGMDRGMSVYVLDSDGKLIFKLETDSWFNDLLRMPDGTIAFEDYAPDETGAYRRALRTIDFAAKALGSTVDMPDIGYYFYPGSGEYDLLIGDNDNVFGYTFGEEEAVKLINWLDSDVSNNQIENITMLPDGRVLCSQRTYDYTNNKSRTEIIVLTKTPYSELPEKTILTLATLSTYSLRDAVVKFNKSNPNYRIQVIDYSQYSNEDDWNAGLTRLSAEIIAGKVPDILSVAGLPYAEYADKGLLIDLYPYIDNDPGINPNDLMQSALRAAEIDGGLYQAFSSFYVITIFGNPAVLGQGGWNTSEFMDVLEENREKADMPLGQSMTKTRFLEISIAFNLGDFIDWEAGAVSFDSPEFEQLLENATILPDDIDYEKITDWESFYVNEEEAVATGRQIMTATSVSDYYEYQYYKAIYGGELVFKGFPNENKNGNSLVIDEGFAICEKSKNKEGAWEFVRTVFEKNTQGENYRWGGFPINREAFDAKAAEAMAMEKGSYNYNGIEIDVTTQADVNAIEALIESASGTASWNIDPTIWSIISEEVAGFFKGSVSAKDAARVIQNRVAILVSERS